MPATYPAGLGLLLGLVLVASPARASCGDGVIDAGEECDDGEHNATTNSCCGPACLFDTAKSPDLIVSSIPNVARFGSLAGITAYGVGTEACNLGSCWLRWYEDTGYHPVIGQNMFRLKDGRLEQIGQAWLKHGFAALADNGCGLCINPPELDHLGVHCSDVYGASGNGAQLSMGPKVDVDPRTGSFPFPDPRMSTTGDAIFKRLQVHHADLDPSLNVGARYFVEAQYVTSDDPGTAHGNDNASFREVTVAPSPYNLALVGQTVVRHPAIHAWRLVDPEVLEARVDAEGLVVVSARATPTTPGRWRYAYALQNVTSQRAVRSFSVPIPPGTTVTDLGFHDVDYHSGEPLDGTDWAGTVSAGAVTWSTQFYQDDPSANALRWGTLYSFRFEADVPPGKASGKLGLFRPGSPGPVLAPTITPDLCFGAVDGSACDDGDACTQGEVCAGGACTAETTVVCPGAVLCRDAEGCDPVTGNCVNPARPDGEPCDDGTICTSGDVCMEGACVGSPNPAPPEVDASLFLVQDSGVTVLFWNFATGSTSYQVLRGSLAALPVGPGDDEVCERVKGEATLDAEDPSPATGFWYVVRGKNDCGPGPFGSRSENGVPSAPRESTACP